MKLSKNDKPWCPQDQPDYLCVLTQTQRHPKSREEFLDRQEELLMRLIQEASPEEIAEQNRRLREQLPWEVLQFLPGRLLSDPQTPHLLMFLPMSEGTPMHEWKVDSDEAIRLPNTPQAEALELAEQLSLESFLSRIL